MCAKPQRPTRSVGFFGWLNRIFVMLLLGAAGAVGVWYYHETRETEVLQEIVSRLTSESRAADIWVEKIDRAESGSKSSIRLKVLEYDSQGKPLKPIYCTFSLNNIIHFEALVVRLNDELVKGGDGKSIYLFKRAFALDDAGNTYESCVMNKPMEVPSGYRLRTTDRAVSEIESKYWRSFWELALDEEKRKAAGVKNAQIEAPATKFLPDKIYRIVLENDGGIYIQANPIPEILKGEHVRIDVPSQHEAPR